MKRFFAMTILVAVLFVNVPPGWATMAGELQEIIRNWDVAKFQTPQDKQESVFQGLAEKARAFVLGYPEQAEPKVWAAIVLSSYAGVKGGLGALSLVEEARDLLLQAEKIDPTVLNGSVYTSLGSLFYQVPGWPVGFGDDDKAKEYLTKAVATNPQDMDANFFMGDFLLSQGKYAEAVQAFELAMQAKSRPGREIADVGRKEEARHKIQEAKQHLTP